MVYCETLLYPVNCGRCLGEPARPRDVVGASAPLGRHAREVCAIPPHLPLRCLPGKWCGKCSVRCEFKCHGKIVDILLPVCRSHF